MEQEPQSGSQPQRSNNRPGGSLSPQSVRYLQSIAVAAEVVEEEEFPVDAKEAAVIAAQSPAADEESGKAMDRAAIAEIAAALDQQPDVEDAADLLALANDASDRSGTRIHALILNALRPGQPIELQRQALYLATQHQVGIVKVIAAREGHPLQQDAEAFLLELDREKNPGSKGGKEPAAQ